MDWFACLYTFVNVVPKGYTLVAQPVDVGINSPFKQEYCCSYIKWFSMACKVAEATHTKVAVPPCHIVAGRALDAWNKVGAELVKKTWIHISKEATASVATKILEDCNAAASAMANFLPLAVA